jgi:uncharacterized protein YcbX
MRLAELWRYPAKSMAGERLQEAELGRMGVPGDRQIYVVDEEGRVLSARTKPGLLLLHAAVDDQGRATVNGLPWEDPAVAKLVREAAGESARLVRAQAGERFDVLPLLVATDGAIAALGLDGRRLRPNLLIGDVPGLAERAWEGRYLRIGEAVIGLHSLRQRCVMTTWDPDTIAQDREVLRTINRELEGLMALNAWAVRGGRVRVGDPVQLTDEPDAAPPPIWGRYAGDPG